MDTVFKQSIPQNVIGGRERSIEIPAIVTSLTLVLIITSLSYFIFQQETLKWMAQEDGIVENLSALNWMLAGLLMLALFGAHSGQPHQCLVFYRRGCLRM